MEASTLTKACTFIIEATPYLQSFLYSIEADLEEERVKLTPSLESITTHLKELMVRGNRVIAEVEEYLETEPEEVE